MRTNINTIAKAAGVSTTTVSNFINCSEKMPISLAKQEAILDAMRRANYHPNSSCSMLGRKRKLPGKGVFIYGPHPEASPMPIIGEPTMKPLLCALAGEIARRLAMSLDVRGVQNKHVLAEWNEVLIDAEFVVCYGHLHRSLHALTYRRNIPLVMINEATGLATDGAFESPPIVDGVSWDAAAHVNTLLDFLVAKGARRLLFVASANLRRNHPLGHAVESEAKVEAFQTYMAAHPQLSGEALLPEALPEITDTFFEARNSYRLLMAKEDVFKGVDAVVGHNDIVAQGIIAALRARGLAPGEDVMVIGDGDFLEYRYCVPAVTTVDYDKEFLARSVCDILDRRFKDNRPAGENVLVPSRIIERETTRKP